MENYKRVNKTTARKMYNHGCSIMLLPCKIGESALDGKHPWIKPCEINIINSKDYENKFDRAVLNFEHYNCNMELGYYSHYYVSLEDLEKYEMCKLMC